MQNVSPAQAPSILMMVGSKPSRKLRTEQAPASDTQTPTIVVDGWAAGSGIGAISAFCSGDVLIAVVSTINSWLSGRVSPTGSDRPTEVDETFNFGCANSRLAAVPTSPTFRTT